MRPVIAWPIAVVLAMLSVTAYLNGEAVNKWVEDNSISVPNVDEGPLVGITNNENWFVVLIDFPDQNENQNCDQNRASNLIDDTALKYQNQGLMPNSTLVIDYHETIITTDFNMADYGHDVNGEHDVGRNGVNPHILAQEIVEKIKQDVEWEKYDLNEDGWVDRFLILHCVKPQEDGSGSTSRIWSHFASIEEIVELPNDMHIAHYTIASQHSSSSLGTIIHEMYHQLGAADLYPVHDVTVNQVWKGVGKWDIMASGNWNGNGVWPALPTSPSIELMGGERHLDVVLEWLPGTDCSGPVLNLQGISEGGSSLKIPIGYMEYVWVEYRSDFGFDSHLPGNGLLVMHQDLLSGDVEDNLINSHPDKAWLKVIEADGEQDMVAGNSEGEQDDLFWDGDTFGSQGITIRNRDGVLVDWHANVSVDNGTPIIQFASTECGHGTFIDLPDHGSVLTTDKTIPIIGECEGISYDLVSSDGREITVIDEEIIFQSSGTIGVVGVITGTVNCDAGSPIDIRHEFEILGNIPIETKFEADIPVTELSEIRIPLSVEGNGTQTWLVGIDGPLSRIAETDVTWEIEDGAEIVLEINPNGLLQERMSVKGELVLASDSGHRYIIQVDLIATDNDQSTFEEWTSPSLLVPLALALSCLWVILGINSSSRKVPTDVEENPISSLESDDPTFVDAFGEPY